MTCLVDGQDVQIASVFHNSGDVVAFDVAKCDDAVSDWLLVAKVTRCKAKLDIRIMRAVVRDPPIFFDKEENLNDDMALSISTPLCKYRLNNARHFAMADDISIRWREYDWAISEVPR